MANTLDASGLTTKTLAEVTSELNTAFETAYGADINLDPSTPDGQIIGIFAQAVVDTLELLTNIYNSFDPDLAVGTTLDERLALNGIQRQAGTHTVTNITVVTSASVSLTGVDEDEDNAYTVSDDAGNEFELLESVDLSAGTNALAFRAVEPGAVLTTPNTITTPVTIVLGVTSVNNPSAYTTLGLDEETDATVKVRRQASVSLAAQGFHDAMVAALLNVDGVTDAIVLENTSTTTDGDGIPAHSIWVIVDGSGADADVADAIYKKRSAGCGMKGDEEYDITQLDDTVITIKWDDVVSENLFMQFTATSLDGENRCDYDEIQEKIVDDMDPGIYEKVNINEVATLAQEADPNCLVTSAGFSLTASSLTNNTLTPSARNKRFAVAAARIIILPILITPSVLSIASGGATQTFTAKGGYSTYTWSVESGAGSINSSSGLYTSSTAGTDVVRCTDTNGNYSEVTITVT